MNRRALARFLGIPAVVVIATISTTTQDRFPEGAGKKELLKVCSGCHEPDNVFAFSKMPAEWSETLEAMSQLGAEGTPEEWRLIEQYLHAQVAMIQINTLSSADLQRTFDVSETVAQAIVTYCKEHGKFASIDDVKKVPGLETSKVEARKERLVF